MRQNDVFNCLSLWNHSVSIRVYVIMSKSFETEIRWFHSYELVMLMLMMAVVVVMMMLTMVVVMMMAVVVVMMMEALVVMMMETAVVMLLHSYDSDDDEANV